MKSRSIAELLKAVDKLPSQAKKEAIDYVEFLSSKYLRPPKRKRFKFAWAGCLAHLKGKYTSVALQHAASE